MPPTTTHHKRGDVLGKLGSLVVLSCCLALVIASTVRAIVWIWP